jgi:phosphoglycerate dehydrogenase-like enzyme
MIRVLVTAPLIAETIEQLNAIPEFEVDVQPELPRERLSEELDGVDAIVCSDPRELSEPVLAAANELKLVVLCGAAGKPVPEALSRRVEVRRSDGGLSTIALLKDFFNA